MDTLDSSIPRLLQIERTFGDSFQIKAERKVRRVAAAAREKRAKII